MKIVTDTKDLTPGKWYAIGVKEEDNTINWGGAPIYRYEGDHCWTAYDGEPAGLLYDPVIDMPITISSADAFMEQS